jgi:hypothetical protein
VLSLRREFGEPDAGLDPPLWVRLLPVFVAIILAQVIAPNEWSIVALFAIAAPLVALTRAGLVLYRRRSA